MRDKLPTLVRYVKNGSRSRWWHASRTNGRIHLGWKSIPGKLLLKADFAAIEQMLKAQYGSRPGATQDYNALRDLLDTPSQHLWVTFEDGFLIVHPSQGEAIHIAVVNEKCCDVALGTLE